MPPLDPEPIPHARTEPLVAVVDSRVFPRRAWLDPILRGARSGYVVPIRSPLIISEVNRVLTWMWLQRHGASLTAAAWRACSADAKRWFAITTAVFRVVDDCPPPEEAWDSLRDTWDVPIWSAAKRCGAHVIVTANLRDGPPADGQGRQVFDGVVWCHPERFAKVLDLWIDLLVTGEHRDVRNVDPSSPAMHAPTSSISLPSAAALVSPFEILLELVDLTSAQVPSEPSEAS